MSKQYNSGLTGSLENFSLEIKRLQPESSETQPFEIKYSELKLAESLGEGTYGEVKKAEYRKGQVAVKIFNHFKSNKEEKSSMLKEAKIMSALRSEYLVGFRGICVNPWVLVMEYCEGGSLFARLKAKEDTPTQQIRWAMQISYGLHQLHLQKILHRDLKSTNILLDGHSNAKLADFNLSIITDTAGSQSSAHHNSAGTIAWMAPELHNNELNSQKTDVYSLGVVLSEIVNRRVPYKGVRPQQIRNKILSGQQDSLPEGCLEVFRSMIKACWDSDPQKRPNPDYIGDAFSKELRSSESLPVRVPREDKYIKSMMQSAMESIVLPSPAYSESRLSTSPEDAKLVEQLGRLTKHRDDLIRKLDDGQQHSGLEKELELTDERIKEIEDRLKEPNSQKPPVLHSKSIRISRSSQTFMPEPKQKIIRPEEWEQQDRLIDACKNGDEKRVSKLLRQGAKPEMANKDGEQPLGAAVWGMCPDVVDALLKAAGGVTPMTWEECKAHNQKYYGEIFIVPEFSHEQWSSLLLIIENSFIRDFHLKQATAKKNMNMNWEELKKYVNPLDGVKRIVGAGASGMATGLQFAMATKATFIFMAATKGTAALSLLFPYIAIPAGICAATAAGIIYHERTKIVELTETGLKVYRDQVRERIEKAALLKLERRDVTDTTTLQLKRR